MTNEEIKEIAKESLLRSAEEVSDDEEILKKLRDKVVIIKENNQIEVKHPDKTLSIQILLYLSGKFMASKILEIFPKATATTGEIAKSLNVSIQSLSRPLGILTGNFIDKIEDGYRIRAYKIFEFLNSLDEKISGSQEKRNEIIKGFKSKPKQSKKYGNEFKIELNKEGIKKLSKVLDISETKLRSAFFFRQDGPSVLNQDLIKGENPREKQLNSTLIYLLVFKYCYSIDEVPAGLLRTKLNKLKIPSLVNLTSNLHKYQEFILHEAGPLGSHKNYYIITPAGEEEIKRKISLFLRKDE